MQGQRSAVGSLPELSFYPGSATSDSSLDPQTCWNNVRNPVVNLPSDCVTSSSNTSISHLNSAHQEGHSFNGWSLGESSSHAAQGLCNQHAPVNVCIGAAHLPRARHYGSSNMLSLSNIDASLDNEQSANGFLFMRTSNPASIRQNGNSSGPDNDDDDCQVIGCVSAFRSGLSDELLPGTSSSSEPFVMPSGSGGFLIDEGDGRPSSSLDSRRLSCKRKSLEGSVGQSSQSGSSNYLQNVEGSLIHETAVHNISSSCIPSPTVIINSAEQVHPRLGLSIVRAGSEVPQPSSASIGSAERSRRSFCLRIDPSHQFDCAPVPVSSAENSGGSYNVLSDQRTSRLEPDYIPLDLGSYSEAENEGHLRPSVTSLRHYPQSQWSRASRSGGSSSNNSISGERVSVPYEEPNSRDLQRDISDHPMFMSALNTGIPSQSHVNWSLASSSRAALNSGVNLPAASFVLPQESPHYPRRLSEFVRRSLLSRSGSESVGQNSSYNPVHPGPITSQEGSLPSGSSISRRHRFHSRSAVLLERHLGSGIPYSARNLAASDEGRSRLVSEIRHVLDLMRRGERLRFEDVMLLDQSVRFGMADLHDRHRDMRLDVDNMSYEELLALEERIGNVCTGLSEETISSRLKQRKCVGFHSEQVEVVPCCICQEEYRNGEDLGTLECGHDFHAGCIKQWLMHKNLCPICKTTGLTK